jgi:hypothetical protein
VTAEHLGPIVDAPAADAIVFRRGTLEIPE